MTQHPGVCLERLRKTKENASQSSQSSRRSLNLGRPEFAAETKGLTFEMWAQLSRFGQKMSLHAV
jgi:hypothetical protein